MVELITDLATKSNEMEIGPFKFGARWVICDTSGRCNTLTTESSSKTVLGTGNCFYNVKMDGSQESSCLFLQNPTTE